MISANLDIFFDKYYNLALRYLSFRPRSEKEIRDYLRKKKVQESLVEIIITKLKEQKFLNDEEFARIWIESRMRFKPRSMKLIKIELSQKGVPKEIIEAIIQNSEFPLHEANRIQNDEAMVRKLIEKKIGKYKNLPRQEVYRKLGRVLVQKGFGWDTIKRGIDEFLKKGV